MREASPRATSADVAGRSQSMRRPRSSHQKPATAPPACGAISHRAAPPESVTTPVPSMLIPPPRDLRSNTSRLQLGGLWLIFPFVPPLIVKGDAKGAAMNKRAQFHVWYLILAIVGVIVIQQFWARTQQI